MMFRKGIHTALLILLVVAVVFLSTSCSKLKPSNLMANHWFTKANHSFTDNLYRQAIEEYEKTLEYNPELLEAHHFLGESYKNLYKPGAEDERNVEIGQKALDSLKKALEIEPRNKDIIFSLGDMYDKLRNFEEAEKLYLMILELEPTNMGNYYVVAEFYKRYAGSAEEEKEGEEGEDAEAKPQGKTPFEKATEMYLRRIETDPESEQGYAYIASFYEGLTPIPEFDLAYEYHGRRIQLDPDNAEAWLSQGVNRWSKTYRLPNIPRRERLALAQASEAALKKANELDPQYPEPYSWLSVLYKSVMVKLDPQRAGRYNQDAERYIERFKEARQRQSERKKLEKDLKNIG